MLPDDIDLILKIKQISMHRIYSIQCFEFIQFNASGSLSYNFLSLGRIGTQIHDLVIPNRNIRITHASSSFGTSCSISFCIKHELLEVINISKPDSHHIFDNIPFSIRFRSGYDDILIQCHSHITKKKSKISTFYPFCNAKK